MIPSVKVSLPQVLDWTIVSEYIACPTKFYYSFARKLGPVEPSIDLLAGGAFAKGLEVTRLCFYWEKFPLDKALEMGMLAAIASFGDVEVPEHKSKKGLDRVVEALAAYFTKYPPATDPIQPHFNPDGKPMVEWTFSIPLPINHPETGLPFIYAGRFDLVGVYNSQLVGVDEKTTSQLGPTWKNKWNLRGQFTGYTWAMHQYTLPVIGMIVRGVSFTKEFGFEESVQLRPQWMIDQWYEQLLHTVERMVKSWERNWYDQDFGDTCASYSGCPFQSLCTSATPENWIEGKFATRDWNPLLKIPYVQPKQHIERIEAPSELKSLM